MMEKECFAYKNGRCKALKPEFGVKFFQLCRNGASQNRKNDIRYYMAECSSI